MPGIERHPFEVRGLGTAPFRVAGYRPTAPAPDSEAALSRDSASGLPLDLVVGKCAYCGQPLAHNVIVRDGGGSFFVIGSDCAAKVGDSRLLADARLARGIHEQAIARAERNRRWQAAVAAQEAAKEEQRARNGGLTDVEVAQHHSETKRKRLAEMLLPLAESMATYSSPFARGVVRDLKRGKIPSGRGRSIMIEMLAKRAGKVGSPGFNEETTRIRSILALAETAMDA